MNTSVRAQVQLPADRTTWFQIHSTPNNPMSAVTYRVTAHLSAAQRVDNKVGWTVQSLDFHKIGTGETWTRILPLVSTADGLWWLKHTDAMDPQPSEFVRPPGLTGRALADSSQYADLDYDIVGHAYTPPLAGQPYLITAGLSYRLWKVAQPYPDEEAEDEPAESGGECDAD